MTRSMTGFGAAEVTRNGILVKVELRSVNHRFFDPSIRISRDWSGLESTVKDLLKEGVARGRVTASVDVAAESGGERLVIDETLADEYRTVLRGLAERHGLDPTLRAFELLQVPDLVRRETRVLEEADVTAALGDAVREALAQLESMRAREGQALAKDLSARLERIEATLDRVEAEARGAAEAQRDRLRERVQALVPDGVTPDPERLATEIALLAEKADVTEELVRFRAHDRAFASFLESGDPVGKRLDFLLQEMNREANTIGSKSSSAAIAHLVVELKEEIERLREQVQNIE
ncbi:MAG: YicC family protein [Gemmatimonadetes bacterium]|nr:YicC family protein [Gemmatimonadota bacterium]